MRFTLNGVPVAPIADGRSPLLYLLRNQCDAKATRFGCGTGQCGACTVMVDGVAEQSCTLDSDFADGKQVLTAEGLAAHPVGQVVRQAFLDEQAAQCGYCINGMLMSLTALLQRDPHADEAALKAALRRHLCRCGTHLRILRAARKAAATLAARASA